MESGRGDLARDDRSWSVGTEDEAALNGLQRRSRSFSNTSRRALFTAVTKVEMEKKATKRAAEGVESVRMPPPWFLPSDTFRSHAERVRERLELGDVPGHTEPPRLAEKWLSHWIFSHLDSMPVRLPVCALLGSMILLHPALVIAALAEEDGDAGFTVRCSVPVLMHALGAMFLWIGLLHVFHNLRGGVRLRVSWLQYIMRQLGVAGEDFESIGFSPSQAEMLAHSKETERGRDVYTEVIANRCDQIERNDKAAQLCAAAEAFERRGRATDSLKAARLYKKAAELDPVSKLKMEDRKIERDLLDRKKKAAELRADGDDLMAKHETVLAHEKYQEAEKMCPECADAGLTKQSSMARVGLSRQSTIARRREHAHLCAVQEALPDVAWTSCLDRPFVQAEIRWAWMYDKPIVVVCEADPSQKYGYFDFTKARAKYAGAFSQTYGSILAVILHINDVPCCCRHRMGEDPRHRRSFLYA